MLRRGNVENESNTEKTRIRLEAEDVGRINIDVVIDKDDCDEDNRK